MYQKTLSRHKFKSLRAEHSTLWCFYVAKMKLEVTFPYTE